MNKLSDQVRQAIDERWSGQRLAELLDAIDAVQPVEPVKKKGKTATAADETPLA